MLVGLALGCQTQFVGSAYIDARTCVTRCSLDKMQMSGMVYLGGYSSACVCEVPRPPAAPPLAAPRSPAAPQPASPPDASPRAAPPGALGAAVGVIQQMRGQNAMQPMAPAR